VARLARLTCVSLGVALAVWLLPASIHIVDWTPDGPARVALLAPLWKLWVAMALTTLAAIAVFATASDGVIDPLALMWLWVIPYVPWLPDRAPALLVLAGPLRWGVLGIALAGSITAWVSSRNIAIGVSLPGRRTVFTLSLALYLFFGIRSAAAVGPDADEPHYLVITQSLLRDHDLAIENNHARGDYHEYFNGELHPDFLRRGLNEVIYSIHAPGLPALLVPAYAVAGYRGAVAMICLFAALTALAVFDLAALLAGPRVAWIAWAAVCLTVPFVPHGWLIFPEMPGALLMAWAALWWYAPLPARDRSWLWRGAALAMLPWLHTKFVILLAAMLAALVLRVWRRPKAVAALLVPAVVSVALWIGSFYALYGAFDPQIPYGDFPRFYVLSANIPRGLLGLLVDQKFGLLIYSPVYALALLGCWMMFRQRERRLFALMLLATIGAFVASSARMYMWWGGSSAPARFLVPILPLLAPMIGVALQGLPSTAARWSAALLVLASVAVAGAGVIAPERSMLFSAPHGFSKMVVAAQGPSPLSYLLPTFTEDAVRAPLALLMPWVIAALLALAVLLLASRTPGPGNGAAAAGALTVFVVGGAVLAGAPVAASQQLATAMRGRLDLMRADEGAALRGLDYARGVRLNERQMLALTSIRVTRSAGMLSDDPRRLAGPFVLPAGRFTLRIASERLTGPDASVLVFIGDRFQIARGRAESVSPIAFDLPVDAPVRVAVSDPTTAAAAEAVEIVAESIVPRRARPARQALTIEAIAERPGAFIAYTDEETYPEGGVFWTHGTHAGTVLVDPAGASTLVLQLHVGPNGGVVRLTVDGQDRSVTMSPNQTQQLEIPLAPRARLVPVAVAASGQFRPSDHDAGSADRRWLGCQVRIGLR
jgi:hypothetical protein